MHVVVIYVLVVSIRTGREMYCMQVYPFAGVIHQVTVIIVHVIIGLVVGR